MKAGDVVSVFSDLEGRCTRGATSFQGKRAFVGNGVAEMDRSRIFCSDQPVKYDNNFYMLLDSVICIPENLQILHPWNPNKSGVSFVSVLKYLTVFFLEE